MAKLAPGGHRYYLEQADGQIDHPTSVASGVEDYYVGGTEPAGQWVGTVAVELGLEGLVVDEEGLRRALSHLDPRTGGELPGPIRRARVPGFDLTFSVPKSASVLFAVGGPAVRDAVWRAQRVAVAEALRYLEAEAAHGRLGAGGSGGWFEGSGLLAAAFEHRTSRAGDPQVHTHVLVANMVRRPDGLWRALDGRLLYTESKTAGYVHEAAFRRELVRELGVEWGPVRHGIAELEGVPAEVRRAFSRRTREIDAYLAGRGPLSAASRQVAAYRTRQAKDYRVRPDELAVEWRDRADRLGFSRDALERALHRAPRDISTPDIAAELRRSEVLTEHRSHFTRRDVIRHAAELARDGATLNELYDAAQRYLESPDVVPLIGADLTPDRIRLRSGRLVSFRGPGQRYSTIDMLAAERRVLDLALGQRDASPIAALHSMTHRAIADRPTIGEDQATMVRRLCLERDGVQVVVGRAGTGKTFALAAARDAWKSSGIPVTGAAVARTAAQNLERSTGIPSTSVAALLARIRDDPIALPARGVLVIDEAGMLGTRDLDRVLTAAAARQAKVVLVGDHHQLPEIAAGGAFRTLAGRLPAIELTINRRQRNPHHRELLDALRAGHADRAIEIAAERGDLSLVRTHEDAASRLVTDYTRAAESGRDAIMLALRRTEVDDLNRRARAWMDATGRLGTERLHIGQIELAAGDRVVLRNNNARLGVQNGARGRIRAIDLARHRVTVDLDVGDRVELPETYLRGRADGQPAIQHGYAFTAHVAQGTTSDLAFVLTTDAAYREWAYVALSRARERTRLYASAEDLGLTGPDRSDIAKLKVALARRLERTQAQTMALEHHSDTTPEHLLRALGPPPEHPFALERWRRTADSINRYRDANGITALDDALGLKPRRGAAQREWHRLTHEIERARSRLERTLDWDRELGS